MALRSRLVGVIGAVVLLGCGGRVVGDEPNDGDGGTPSTQFSCTVEEVDYGYSWCLLAPWDGSCPGVKSDACAPDFLARCSYAGVVLHYYDVVDLQIVEASVRCGEVGGTFTTP